MIRYLDRLIELLLVLALASTAFIVSIAVFFRYVMDDSLSWSEDVTSKTLVWITFLGAYACFRNSSHLSVDVIPKRIGKRGRKIVQTTAAAVMIVYFLIMAWYSAQVVWAVGGSYINTLDIPRGWFLVALPVSFVLMCIALVYSISGRSIPADKEEVVE